MRNFTCILILLSSQLFFSQGITVDISTYSNQQLVTTKLLGNDCITASNFSSSSSQSVGYFNKSGSGFLLSEGIIIRSGKALFTAGQYTGNNINSQLNTNSDPFLQQLSNANGQTEPITDVGFLEFDFVPVSNKFSLLSFRNNNTHKLVRFARRVWYGCNHKIFGLLFFKQYFDVILTIHYTIIFVVIYFCLCSKNV